MKFDVLKIKDYLADITSYNTYNPITKIFSKDFGYVFILNDMTGPTCLNGGHILVAMSFDITDSETDLCVAIKIAKYLKEKELNSFAFYTLDEHESTRDMETGEFGKHPNYFKKYIIRFGALRINYEA